MLLWALVLFRDYRARPGSDGSSFSRASQQRGRFDDATSDPMVGRACRVMRICLDFVQGLNDLFYEAIGFFQPSCSRFLVWTAMAEGKYRAKILSHSLQMSGVKSLVCKSFPPLRNNTENHHPDGGPDSIIWVQDSPDVSTRPFSFRKSCKKYIAFSITCCSRT